MSDTLTRLNEQRLHAATELRALVESIATGTVEQSAEVAGKLAALEAAIDGAESSIRSAQRAEQAVRESDQARAEYARIVRPAVLDQRESAADDELMAFLRGEKRSIDFDLRPVARELRAIRSGAQGKEFRDLVTGTAALGGNLVPTSFLRQLYQHLEYYARIRSTNVRVVTTTSGESLDMPRVATFGTAAVVGEGTALAEADATFSKVTLGAFKYGQLIQVSTELMQDSGVDIMSFVAEDAGRAIGRVTGSAFFNGSGSNAPQGVLTAYATGVTGQNGATGLPSYANLVDMVYAVDAPYRERGAFWAWRDATVGGIRKIVDSQNRPLWEPSLQMGEPDRLLGYPVVIDPAVAALATGVVCGAFGDFSGFVIRDVGSVRFERSDDFAFDRDTTTFRVVMRTDSDVLDTRSIRVYRGGTA